MLYGTAWKADRTQDLVAAALRAGFRGIDTACQPKHYKESGVGDAIAAVAEAADTSPPITREDLFLQTKYTPIRGRVPRLSQPPVHLSNCISDPLSLSSSSTPHRLTLRTNLPTFPPTESFRGKQHPCTSSAYTSVEPASRVHGGEPLPRGQDPTDVPFDPASSIPDQVAQSFAVSLANLRTTYVDSLVLHSPFEDHEDTMLAWRAMEALYGGGLQASSHVCAFDGFGCGVWGVGYGVWGLVLRIQDLNFWVLRSRV
jgi:hypothetical protein